MLDLDLDLAELLLLAPADDAPPIATTDHDAVERFVDGLCRSVGALAACIVPPDDEDDGQDGGPARPIGLVGRSEAARAALLVLLGTERALSRRGYSWIRDDHVAGHCGLMIAMPGTGAGTGRTGHLMLAFARDHLDDEDGIAQILALAPSLGMMAGAVQAIAATLAATERRHRALAAVLRQSECGIVVVAADQRVVFANPAAHAILDSGDGMELRRGMLRPTRYQDAVRFHAALDAVIAPPRHRIGARGHGAMLLLERPGPERPLIAVIAPVGRDADADPSGRPGATERGQGAGGAAAIVRLMRPEIGGARGIDPICHLHGLSPVETQLVGCLTRGLTLGEAATQMRIKPDTARTYLKQVFAKTDTHRQSDLLQLFLRYQRAVSGDVLFEAA